MDQQTLIEYTQALVAQRTNLELELLKLQKELRDVRASIQTKEKEKEKEVQTQDGVLNND